MIYFDNAATSFLKPPCVKNAVRRAMEECASPGRGGHGPAARGAEKVYACRELAGEFFSCQPEQVVFTMNATHGLNMAISSLVSPGGRVVISGFEHNAVLRPLHALDAEIHVAGKKLFDPANTLEGFARLITVDTQCVICTHVSNVFGYILPVKEISALCRERDVPFILDASQSAGILPVSFRETPADFIAMPGHKGLYGPQGTGLLLCGRLPKPLICGGTGSLSREKEMPDFLPDRGEAGTQNVPGICGLAMGIRFVKKQGLHRIFQHERRLCKILASGLNDLPGYKPFLAPDPLQTGVLSVAVGEDCESFAQWLAERDVAVRAGLHCAPLAHESAGTLETGTVRFSPSIFTTQEQARELLWLIRRKSR